MDDLTKYWERPLLSRVPVYGFSSLDMAGMQERGWSHMPSMEASLVGHLNPRSAVGLSTIAPKLPQRSYRFSASIFEKIYKSSTQTGRATNAITLLLAYITELEEEMTRALSQGNDVIELWTEICTPGRSGSGLEVLGAAGEASDAFDCRWGAAASPAATGRCGFCSFVSHHWRRCSRRALPEALQPP
ncbi:hypothetical protein G5714_021104 [Onychostoma macrolepis]|uniref:Uncharacterized protein n=1 Tax=Onychostoma macrolepis TaxID=369639 RepID=A0A7J6BW60_9TELE|nr:hypothetical protein G5714_021104 [Onychostoma macrolepis]